LALVKNQVSENEKTVLWVIKEIGDMLLSLSLPHIAEICKDKDPNPYSSEARKLLIQFLGVRSSISADELYQEVCGFIFFYFPRKTI
jgi:hypothetical protein